MLMQCLPGCVLSKEPKNNTMSLLHCCTPLWHMRAIGLMAALTMTSGSCLNIYSSAFFWTCLQVTASVLPEQQLGSESPVSTGPLICNEHSLATTDAEEDGEAASPTGSGHVSGSGSRPPTEQEIKHMDELDLSMNLGSLLGPGESWIVQDNDHFATLEGKADQSDQAAALNGEAHGDRPFQELFPVTQS